MYPAPEGRFLRWISDIGSELPEQVQQRLRSSFFTSRVALVVGAVNTIAVATVAFLQSGYFVFAVIALSDLLLLVARIILLRRVKTASGPVFATGLLWASLQAATIALVVASGDLALSAVALASGLAAIGGIIGRNFAARRYAMTQVLIIDLSFKFAFLIAYSEFQLLILMQTVVFCAMNWSVMSNHRTAAIRAIVNELESRHLAITDPLTGLLNRRGLEDAYSTSKPAAQDRMLFYLDLDGFKYVNDHLGHAVGDILLQEVGRRIRDTVGPDEMVCRLGGDEFLMLTGRLGRQEAYDLGARIIAAVSAPYQIGEGVNGNIGVSIGVAKEMDKCSLTDIMKRADRALYAAKSLGKGRCELQEFSHSAFDHAA